MVPKLKMAHLASIDRLRLLSGASHRCFTSYYYKVCVVCDRPKALASAMKMKKQGGGRNEYTNFELFHLAAAAGSGSTASRQHKRRGRKKYGLEAAAGRGQQ